MIRFSVRAISIASCIALYGCANYYTDKHFDRGQSLPQSVGATESDRATVYYFRQRAWGQALIYIPIPPLYYAVDEKLVSIMPLASNVRLSLPAGTHTFSRLIVSGGGFISRSVDRTDFKMALDPGKTYYIGTRNGFASQPFGVTDDTNGLEIVKDTEPAKILHNPVSIATFTSRIAAMNNKPTLPAQSGATPPAPATGANTNSLSDALPSSRQVGDFLEGLAAVALIGLMIFGVATASKSDGPSPYPSPALSYSPNSAPPTPASPSLYAAPPAQRLAQPTRSQTPTSATATWQSSSGTLSDILQSKDLVILKNESSGVSYRIEDGRISGSDGSRFTVRGPNIYSDTGQSYQVIGNSLFTSDGRSCVKTGIVINCR
jgi:hypothetical protein